ncbi:gramicidin S biosynthesis thioesterase GrsT [Aneurinibacillus aneurinilyticus]|uniref:gramicidin S biosynthesis thioesterase GrsT n=1 Tax=Aneurinibacillus aneurinilyticus TaxID=1391 RepID=UPI0023F1637A|nr:gramicidin S biosynthesis thioesterase GrsT [Aneurinibacillus aneurinilyticus]
MTFISQVNKWFVNANLNPAAKLRLFCVPYAGGGASVFHEWSHFFPKEIEICSIQLPGRENRGMEDPLTDLQQIVEIAAEEIQPLINIPFAFFGHSMGALISFELARKIRQKNNVNPVHLFVSGRHAPQISCTKQDYHLLPDDQFIQELRLLNGTPEIVLQNAEMMGILLPRLRADFSACGSYQYKNNEPLDCPITAFGGKDDIGVTYQSLEAWREQTKKEFSVCMYPGDHFFLYDSQHEMIEFMCKQLHLLLAPKI